MLVLNLLGKQTLSIGLRQKKEGHSSPLASDLFSDVLTCCYDNSQGEIPINNNTSVWVTIYQLTR